MRPHPHRIATLSIALVAAAAAVSTATPRAQDEVAPPERPTLPAPRLVTAATLAEPARLAELERPGTVLFRDDFESDESLAHWFEIRGRDDGRAARIEDPELAHGGRCAMRFVAPARDGASSGAGASAWLGPDGYERVHFRRYIRFAADYDQGNLNHTGGGLAAVAGRGRWDEMGKAGIRPTGDDRFTIGFEPWRDWGRQPAPGYMFVYAYWMDMRRDRDGNYWGNMLGPEPERRVVPPRGRWVCLETMVKANTIAGDGPPDERARADGELAAWIDGQLYLHYDGIRWRRSELVRVKRFDIGIYIHQATRDNEVLYDDVVVSTGYVGPEPAAQPAARRR
ncbi:MAG: hypothetical protein IPM29_28505 [Planctomycetes bacterium]|nr:hypothetical protein [Planctomycetota bacterium]